MPEEVIFEVERNVSREEIAEYFNEIANKLGTDGTFALDAGDQHVSLTIPERPTFEVKAERETSPSGGPVELSVEFEIEWDEGSANGDGPLSIE